MVAAGGTDDQYRVHAVKTLRKPGQDQVRKQLEDAASQVQPIMAKRKWTVPVLTEFLPKNPGLLGLNVNGGGGKTSVIKVRVRRGAESTSFYPYEHTLGTILHELVHNVIGPHSAKFYSLLDEITQECEELMAKGIRGPGHGSFTGRSSGRLGTGSGHHNPPGPQLKDVIRKAAEERMQRGGLMSGGRRLGGNSLSSKGMSPAQAAALAAERRAKDGLWCSCKDEAADEGDDGDVVILDNSPAPRDRHGASTSRDADVNPSATAGSAGSSAGVIDLTQTPAAAPRLTASTLERFNTGMIDLTDDRPSAGPQQPVKRPRADDGVGTSAWACSRCTLINSCEAMECTVCSWRLVTTCKPPAVRDGSKGPDNSGPETTRTVNSGRWDCQQCSLINVLSDANCAVCGSWRYSRGPPIASAAPPSVNGMT